MPPITPPAGPIVIAQEALRVLLADCPSFRAWCRALTQAQALARIYLEGPPPAANRHDGYTAAEWATLRPFATICLDRESGYQARRQSRTGWIDGGRFELLLEQSISEEIRHDQAEADRRFLVSIGGIIEDLEARAGRAGQESYLDCVTIKIDRGPFRAHEDEIPTNGDYQIVSLGIEWGGQS